MDKKLLKFAPIPLLMLLFLVSCSGSGGPVSEGEDQIRASTVEFCLSPKNETKPECIQKCSEDPNFVWCQKMKDEAAKNKTPKFECPNDGSFKAVNPFTGEPAVISANPPEDYASTLMLATKAFVDGNIKVLFFNKGSFLWLESGEQTVAINMGTTITSVDAIKFDGKYYAIAGTTLGITIVPFTFDEGGTLQLSQNEDVKTFTNIGGVTDVVTANSIDLSGSTGPEDLPEGMWASLNLPPGGGAAKESAAAATTFVYMLNTGGDVWRIKLAHIFSGGCIEKLYSSTDNVENGKHMSGRQIAVAGQYLVVLTSTANQELPLLDNNAMTEWESYEENLIDQKQSHRLITRDFYWLVNHLSRPSRSSEKIKVLNLLTSSDGTFNDLNVSVSATEEYHATDILLLGNILYVSAFVYDEAIFTFNSDLDAVNLMDTFWNAARVEGFYAEGRLFDMAKNSDSGLIVVNIDNPGMLLAYRDLPARADALEIPATVYSTITNSGSKLYFQGENRYLASVEIENLDQWEIIPIPDGLALTPWSSTYDYAKNKIVTAFIFGLEKVSAQTHAVETTLSGQQ